MIIDINFEESLKEARGRAEQMVLNGLYNRFDASIEKRIDRAEAGCLGEIAFEEFLKGKRVAFRTDRDDFKNRHADEFDFMVNGYKIDVKVAKTDKPPIDSWTYGYPQQQIGMEKDFVVVGAVNYQRETVEMYGWIPFREIVKYPLKTVNSFAGFRYKTPNYEFPWGALNKDFDKLIQFLTEQR